MQQLEAALEVVLVAAAGSVAAAELAEGASLRGERLLLVGRDASWWLLHQQQQRQQELRVWRLLLQL
jgi:hypothetical protein